MYLVDLLSITQWWGMLLIVGIVFFPLSSIVFSAFIDKGYIFSKILGVIFISYIVFVLGILRILSFEQSALFLIIVLFAIFNVFLIFKYPNILISLKSSLKIVLFEEFLFLTALLFWSYIRAHQPEIHGLEKYMDFGFVNSILRSTYFPPKDMWFTPHSINYYYFGHLMTAVLTKLSTIPSLISYNLMIATLFAFTFCGSFSIGLSLISQLKTQNSKLKSISQKLKVLVGGLLTAFLVSFAGNLHTIYLFFKNYNVESPQPFWQLLFSLSTFPNAYWYPNATRFIHNTIHEFPLYSFVVSDLHGHVLSIPIVLTIIALLMHEFLKEKKVSFYTLVLCSFLLATAYMTNAWDGPIYFLLTALVIGLLSRGARSCFAGVVLVLICSIIFALPFSLHFNPFVSGIGVICAPDFLTRMGKLGPFLFEANHCLRSPLWQLFILYGFFYFWVILFIKTVISSSLSLRAEGLRLKAEGSDIFILLLTLLATLLIIIPEFFYIKDIYPAHYRANTMFKLVYESFILLSLSTGYIITRLIFNLKSLILNLKFVVLVCIGIIGLLFVMIYPYFAINSYYGDLKTYKGLNGLQYLKNTYSDDYLAILWLNKNIKGQPVILEAQGDSYTDYGRVSANTGLPTVLGWLVHEWLWRGTYDIPSPRIAEVKTLYETKDVTIAKKLINTYHIELIFIGNLEKEKYPTLEENKFQKLGNLLFQTGQTKIYKIN